MNINYIRKIKVELTNEEIEALKTAKKIFESIEAEFSDNDIESDEAEEIIGEAYGEHCCYCSNDISDAISEIIGLANY